MTVLDFSSHSRAMGLTPPKSAKIEVFGSMKDACAAISRDKQLKFHADSVQLFRITERVESVGPKLKALRQQAQPALSIRRMAELLGIPYASYNFYEREAYKKPFLPIDFARKVAAVLAERNVDAAEVMKLAGLTEGEAEPEATAIEAARPPIQYVPLQVALPSEAALREMFRSLLVLVPEGASRDETAEILAQWLPSGFAGIGPYLPDPGAGASSPAGTLPQTGATNRREASRTPRS